VCILEKIFLSRRAGITPSRTRVQSQFKRSLFQNRVGSEREGRVNGKLSRWEEGAEERKE
jgi:hypothetical protein